jgi:hypothetical protein
LRAQLKMEMPQRALDVLSQLGSAVFRGWMESYGWLARRVAHGRERYARELLWARHAGAFFFVARKSAAIGAYPLSEKTGIS